MANGKKCKWFEILHLQQFQSQFEIVALFFGEYIHLAIVR